MTDHGPRNRDRPEDTLLTAKEREATREAAALRERSEVLIRRSALATRRTGFLPAAPPPPWPPQQA